jgi:hypothetical protein
VRMDNANDLFAISASPSVSVIVPTASIPVIVSSFLTASSVMVARTHFRLTPVLVVSLFTQMFVYFHS